jgi:hypothetical protein
MSDLTLHLKAEYWHEIKNNTKPFEFRKRNKYWEKRLIGRKYENVVFCLGYPKKDDLEKRIKVKYTGYEMQTITHSHFGKSPEDVFAIRTSGLIDND